MGPVNRDQLPEIYKNARFGLNYTPDIYPYNVQTSTKTLEYLLLVWALFLININGLNFFQSA